MCVFCKIINKELPAKIVYEDELVVAFHDINPQAPIHILIVPKEHIPTVNDLEEKHKELIGHIFLVAKKIAKDMGFAENGYRILINCNKDGGQEIYHIHYHLFAGKPLGKMICE
ncbi:histidine triad (HIT) protein [Desulfurobacterium thermolithotrophum DSM 11699]|uniref:Histidine triad (HIT) protein n=1 Tax=Desulfurobacterium thermolithotrophum (strain DSM 11699 / BSA) TaxID=868864 RepID=F0S057_DESTD|nr:histidine triad nucleotide-binding protein [Desulfurobacterium thermolithotrophum]ADY73738.1 histidine triad (HIT) protein [Desulfurobacterium thermolithotrophum DSM 11699]